MADSLRSNLPLQLTSFIGREREIAEIKRLLGSTRLLTLTGAGGCGKTRLALEVAADLLAAFPDGVWFVDLAPLSDPALVPQAFAAIFDLRESSQSSLIESLKIYLRTKNLLVILDNCEHLIQACADLSDALLRAVPNLKILATSREGLNIAGETSFRVPSLSLPDPDQPTPFETMREFESIQLFVERARAANTKFQFNAATAPVVAEICRRLDGIPLALELAAVRVKALSVEQIAARLGDVFQLLTGGSRTVLPRYQTLRGAIDWSYDLLTEAEQILFQRLAVFVGDWTLEAAEFVTRDGYDVLDVQSRLIDKSLVLARETANSGTRYRMLEPIRQYAHDKLLASGKINQLRSRHLEFFLKFAEEERPKLRSVEQLNLLNQQRSEYENLRTAIEWVSEGGSRISSNPDMVLRIISALDYLGSVYVILGVRTQAITLYQKAIALSTRLASADKIITLRLHGKIVKMASSMEWSVDLPRFEAMNQIGLTSLATLQAELNLDGLEPHAENVELLTILSRAAWRHQVSPDWDAAERYAVAAVAMGEKVDAPVELSLALRELDSVYFARGLLRERVQVSFRRLALTRDPRFSDVRQHVYALDGLAYALVTVGDYTLALGHLQEAAGLAEQIQPVYLNQRSLLSYQATCLFGLDRWDDVLDILAQVRDSQKRYPREIAGPECLPIALAASVHARRGEIDLAAAEREEAHSIMTATSGPLAHWSRAQIY